VEQEGHVDPEPDKHLEDVQVDWDTEKKKLDSVRNAQMYLLHTIGAGAGACP